MSTSKQRVSHKVSTFTESVIREMTRLAHDHNAINLAQGFPNFPAPQSIKDAACQAIQDDINQYSITWGAPGLRAAVAEKYKTFYGWEIDPEREITVACGSTESMIASILGLVDPGDRVLVFEPFYENYGPDAVIGGALPVYVPLDPAQNWALDFHQLEQKIRAGRIRALILNTPNNPTGKVFTREELVKLSKLAQSYDFYVITDEIYEHIVYDGESHHLIALLPGMRDRTITISGLSKTFSITGWRIGYIVAPPDLTNAIRKIHDFLTVGAAAPLQEAGSMAMRMGKEYYQQITSDYQQRRDYFVPVLQDIGFQVWKPSGAYYVMVDISPLTDVDDVTFVDQLIRDYGVAAVPGSSFFHKPELGRQFIRFAFCKTQDVLEEAAERLRKLKS
jgi:aspartate/methionine/tyrosine aminotransferase